MRFLAGASKVYPIEMLTKIPVDDSMRAPCYAPENCRRIPTKRQARWGCAARRAQNRPVGGPRSSGSAASGRQPAYRESAESATECSSGRTSLLRSKLPSLLVGARCGCLSGGNPAQSSREARKRMNLSAATLVMLLLAGATSTIAEAAFTVTSTADAGGGTLREAMLDANMAVGPTRSFSTFRRRPIRTATPPRGFAPSRRRRIAANPARNDDHRRLPQPGSSVNTNPTSRAPTPY